MYSKNNYSVLAVTKEILLKLDVLSGYPSGKADLAKIRNSVGKPINEAVEVWPILFENLPEEFLSNNATASNEELAIVTAIQLYSLHKQGGVFRINTESDGKSKNLGYSLRVLRTDDNTTSIDRRFNSMITSTTFDELYNHLKTMIKILKSKFPNVYVDYAKLAEDLFWYLNGHEQDVRLRWAKEYYMQNKRGEKNNEQQ